MKWCAGLATVLLACSDGGVTGKAPPQAILSSRLDQGDGNACEFPDALTLGTFDGAQPIAAPDGSGANAIACTVHDRGDGSFDVTGEIKVDGKPWLLLTGTVPKTYDKTKSPNGVGGLRATFSNAKDGAELRTYRQDEGCLVEYRTDKQGVVAGRVWGHVSCNRAAPEGGDATRTCSASAQFRFENCAL